MSAKQVQLTVSASDEAEEIADSYDEQLLHRAVRDAGVWAYGTIFVEVWVMNEDRTKLYRPSSGWWIDSSMAQTDLSRFVNPEEPDYMPTSPLSPGIGLPGILWNECQNYQRSESRVVAWRDIEYISMDPDQPRSRRLEALVESGLGWAAGISFEIGGEEGIVIYMARKGVNRTKLQTSTNEDYLVAAADLIGSAWSLRSPRRKAIESRKSERDVVIRRIRSKLVALVRTGVSLEYLLEDPAKLQAKMEKQESAEYKSESKISKNLKKAKKYLARKSKQIITKTIEGGHSQPPPQKSFNEAFSNGIFVFLTILMVAHFSFHLENEYGPSYGISLGPFGALSALLYGLTAAPSAQPRSSIVAQVLSVSMALGVSYISVFPLYLRQAISSALSIAVTTKLGIPHPPAGAAAIAFSSGGKGWSHMLTFLTAYIVVILSGTVVNNFNDRRQYPTFWGLVALKNLYEKYFPKSKDEPVEKAKA